MKTIIKNTAVLVLILTLFASCSKFEDGPKISLRSVEKRILGKYTIEYFAKNGTDLTSYWNQYYNLTFDFHDDPNERPVDDKVYITTEGSIDSCGTWKYYNVNYGTTIHDEGDRVLLPMFNYIIDTTEYPDRLLYPLIVYSFESSVFFTITRLTYEEMWLKLEDNGDYYEIHLKE